MQRFVIFMLAAGLISGAAAYPLDGVERSGIRRLAGYQTAQTAPTGPKIAPGGLLGWREVSLKLEANTPEFDQPGLLDPELQRAVDSIFRNRDPSYSVVVIDVTDPARPATAMVRPDVPQNPGSVGKILTMLALFDALAKTFPDVEDRARVLRETGVPAGEWVLTDSHKVPKYSDESRTNQFATIAPDDRFRLSEWIDHMVSASANAAGSVVWREAMLIRHFGGAYRVPDPEAREFFKSTPPGRLSELAQQVVREPLTAAELDITNLQQGSFWTRTGKQKVPGGRSFATTRELARYMFRLEQGRLVDQWSSLEMKRYLYMTKRRYRYVYPPELHQSAAFFKSGSLYECRPEENFKCGKYMGNKRNLMNSVTIIESLPGAARRYHYIVALMSNVLKVNSAWDHSRLGAAIHEAVLTRGAVKVQEQTDPQTVQDAGRG